MQLNFDYLLNNLSLLENKDYLDITLLKNIFISSMICRYGIYMCIIVAVSFFRG